MSRLRPHNVEHQYGYISRADGDQQLLNGTVQETFFRKLCDEFGLQPLLSDTVAIVHPKVDENESGQLKQSDKLISQCLSSLRKLREGIIASDRQDDFAIEVFETTVRYAILHDHVASYLPAMHHLHNTLYLSGDYKEIEKGQPQKKLLTGLLALHLCSIHEYHEALEILEECRPSSDRLVKGLIRALLHSNWLKWHILCKRTNTLQSKMVEAITREFCGKTIATISTAYMFADVSWLCTYCGKFTQDELVEKGWIVKDSRIQFKASKSSNK